MIETVERLNNQAIILAKDGSFKEAIACFARALTIEKDNSLLWYNLALTYRDAGHLKEAKHALFKSKEFLLTIRKFLKSFHLFFLMRKNMIPH